jgi:hypothetical protein
MSLAGFTPHSRDAVGRPSKAGRALGQGPVALTHPRGGPSTCLLLGVETFGWARWKRRAGGGDLVAVCPAAA